MNTTAVKTNKMCGSLVAKISPALNEGLGRRNWQAVIRHPKKVLTVITGTLTGEEIIKVGQKAGSKAEKLSWTRMMKPGRIFVPICMLPSKT